MVRISRVVVPGFLHHITQRGNNRRQQTSKIPLFCKEITSILLQVYFLRGDLATDLELPSLEISHEGLTIPIPH